VKRFYVNVINDKVRDAALVAERLLQYESSMMKELRAKNDWKYNSGSGEEVYQKIVKCTAIAPILFYKAFNPWSSVIGYSDGKAIYINSRKINQLTHEDIVANLCHEWLHFGPGFSHGNNYPSKEKNQFSVPYFVSSNIKKWL
jgi:predicted metallopeptidase